MGRALVYQQLEDKRNCRAETQAALEADGANPRVKWLRVLLAANQEEFSQASQLLEFAHKSSELELAAARTAVLILACKKKQSKKDVDSAGKYAELAIKLTGDEDWFSYFVLASASIWPRRTQRLARASKRLVISLVNPTKSFAVRPSIS